MVKTKWVLKNKVTNEKRKQIAERYNISEAFAHMLINMGIEEQYEELRDDIPLHSPLLLKDMDKIRDILLTKKSSKIRIMGDMDVDGICSTTILVVGLRKVGFEVDYDIPDRIMDGYGMNKRMVKDAYDKGVDVIITCDNGIAQNEAIEYAKTLGITVLVTDHHQVPYVNNNGVKEYIYPNADAIVDPMQQDCGYPYKGICGAMIAYKVVSAMWDETGTTDIELDNTMRVLAGIATVCDVMDVVNENRTLIKESLVLLKSTSNIGLKALLEAASIKTENISTYSYGFVLGPMLNASGRLDTAKLGVELFLEKDERRALEIAHELYELNEERKDLTQQGLDKALEQTDLIENSKVLVLYVPNIHESVAGIIAGRVRETFNKPTIILTDSENGGLKGSGRSIEQYNMFEEITAVKDGLLTKFGGHEMAAGMSLEKDKLERFRNELNKKTTLTEDDFCAKIAIDIELPLGWVTEALIDEIKTLEPFGKGNPRPVIACRNIEIKSGAILGNQKNVLKLKLMSQNGMGVEGILFGKEKIQEFVSFYQRKFSDDEWENAVAGFDSNVKLLFTYRPDINTYKGRKSIQVVIENYN